MRLAPGTALWCLLAPAACGGGGPIFLAFPAPHEQGSVLVTVQDGSLTRAYAEELPLPGGLRLPWDLPADSSLEVELHLYTEALSALHLERGELQPDTGERVPLGRAPRESWATEVREQAALPWSRTSTTDNALSTLPIAERFNACARFEIHAFSTPATRDFNYALALGGGEGLLVGQGGEVLRVSEQGVRVLPSVTSTINPHALAFDEDGRILVAGLGVYELELDPSPRLKSVAPHLGPPGGLIRAVSSLGRGAERSVFVVSNLGAFERWSNGAWEHLADLEIGSEGEARAVLERLSAEHLVAGRPGDLNLLHYEAGRLRRERPLGLVSGIAAIAQIPAVGLVVTDQVGRVSVFKDGEWLELGTSGIGLDTFGVAPLYQGMLISGQGGFIAQYLPRAGFCPPEPAGTYSTRALVALAPQLFLVAGEIAGGQSTNGVAVVRAQ